jgi:RNA polymerase sigma factor (sigma-70 family)
MISEELLKRCMKDDRKAHYELYKVCFSSLMSVCMRYKKNEEEAAEMLNAGFLKIVTKLHTYKTEVPFEAWIRRIMINTIITDYHKHKKYKESTSFPELGFERLEKGSAQNNAESNMSYEYLLTLINTLPDTSRNVFNMYVLDGMTHDEIASALGISQGTSKWHLHEARKKIQLKLTKLSYLIPWIWMIL